MLFQFARQPLLHFFVIGAAIFGLFALVDDGAPEPAQPEIVVSVQDAAWLANQFQATWRRAPTSEELENLIDEFVRDEVYVREALSLGLDQGDTVVRRRLRQKMEFLMEASAEAANPSDETLQAYYETRQEEYALPPRVAFRQILVPPGDGAAAEGILQDLAAGADPEAIGARTLLPSRVNRSAAAAVDGTFGTGFFDRLSALQVGQWGGPVASGFGQHIVRVDRFETGDVQPFEAVRDRVELDWRAAKAEELRTTRFEILKDQYSIDRPDPAAVLSQ